MRSIDLELVSDFVCPWCLIGEARLRHAIAESGLDVRVRMRPYLLDPSTPDAGRDLREHLRATYRVEPSAMFARVEAAAKESGLDLDFERIRSLVNTLGAHTLVRHAEARGTQLDLTSALFEAYFRRGENLGDPEVLARIAAQHGFSAEEALRLVSDPTERAETEARVRAETRRGVRGVPCFVSDTMEAVSGAQPVDFFVTWLRQLAATDAPSR